jgi:hypothetical protein
MYVSYSVLVVVNNNVRLQKSRISIYSGQVNGEFSFAIDNLNKGGGLTYSIVRLLDTYYTIMIFISINREKNTPCTTIGNCYLHFPLLINTFAYTSNYYRNRFNRVTYKIRMLTIFAYHS